MKSYLLSTLSLATAVVLGMSGCSGGSSSSSNTSVSSIFGGTAIDGTLVGSTVCIDTNNNGLCSDESVGNTDTTDIDGNFSITSTSTGNLLVLDGNDSGTGLPFTGSLKAPSGSSVITPLTSAVQALIENGSTQAQAESSIKAALGVDENVTLTTFNPLKQIEDGNSTQKIQAQAVLASQAELQTIVHAAAVTIAGSDKTNTATIANSMDNVFRSMVKNFKDKTTQVTITPKMMETATKEVADVVFKDNTAAKVAAKSVAKDASTNAVASAANTKATIEAIVAFSDVAQTFNNTITAANTTLQNDMNASSSAAGIKDVNSTRLAEIAAAQDLQQAEEAKIAAATAAAEKAAADLVAAKAAAEAQQATKAQYEAYLAAVLANEQALKAESDANAVAEAAAAEAAKFESDLAADKAAALAKAEAEAEAAQVKKVADAAAAQARIDAARAAEVAAKAAADLNASKAAAAAADLSASINIAKLDVNVSVNNANASVKSAEDDLNATQAIVSEAIKSNFSINTASNVIKATDAVAAAKIAATAVLTQLNLFTVDTNATTAQILVTQAKAQATTAKAQATLASEALTAVKKLLIDAQLTKIDTEAKARIAAAIAASRLIVSNADSNATKDLNTTVAYALQAQIDANETTAIANVYTSSTTAQAEKTKAQAAQTAAAAAQTAATAAKAKVTSSLTSVDANVTEINAAKYATASLTDAATVKAQSLIAIAEATKAANALSAIKIIKNTLDVATSKTAAASNLALIQASATAANASATAARASATEAGTIATTNSNAATYASAAAYAATSAESFAAQATQLLSAASTHKASTDAATLASVAATEAGYVQIKVAPAAEAATGAASQATLAATALASAKNVQAPVVVNGGIVNGMSFINFNEDNGQIEVGKNTLTSGTLIEERYLLDKSTGDFNLTTKSPSFVLTASGWVEDTNNSYTLSNGTATFSDMQVKIAKTIDLTTLSSESTFVMQELSKYLPPDANVTFTSGAQAYTLAFKKASGYSLGWMPTSWETNASYSSLEAYMISGNNPAGVHDAMGYWNGVYFQTQEMTTTPIDINGSVVTTLTEGLEGNLTAKEYAIIVGKWSVIKLPNNDLALLITPKVGTEGYFGNQFDNLLAVVNGNVYQGKYETTDTDFVEDNSSIEFNAAAFENIKNFIKDYITSQNSGTGGGFTLEMLTSAPLFTVTIPTDGTSAYYCDVNYSTNGTVSVSINGQTAQTYNYTLTNGEVHLPDNTYARLLTVDSNVTGTVANISVFNSANIQIANRLGFLNKSARDAYFASLSGNSSAIYNFSGLVGQTIYFENANGVFGMRTFNADNTTTGIISTSGVYDGNYTTHDNIVSITTIAGTTNISFAEQPTFSHLSDFNVSVNGTASNWRLASPIPTAFINQEISFLNNNGGHGTRYFNDKGIVTGVSGMSGQTAIPYTAGYMYDVNMNRVYIRDGISTIIIDLPSDNNLTNLPVIKMDANGTVVAVLTTTWTLPSTSGIPITTDMLAGKVVYDDFNDSAYGNIIYGKMTVETNNTITRHEITLDSNGSPAYDSKNNLLEYTLNFPYTIPNGVLTVDAGVDGGGIKTFTLHSTTSTTWHLTDESGQTVVWDITGNKPSGYPSNL